MIQPFAAPISPPINKTTGTITQTLGKIAMPNIGNTMPLVISHPATMPHSPSVAPIERSIPAVIMTNVIPSARKALMAICLIIMTMLPPERNPGTVKAKNPTIKNSAIKVRSFRISSRIFSREKATVERGAMAADCSVFISEPLSTCGYQRRFFGTIAGDIGS